MCVCVLKLENTCAVSAISFCHRRGLGRWLIENAYTAVTFSSPLYATMRVCVFICVFVFLFTACVRLSTNSLTLTETLRLRSFGLI